MLTGFCNNQIISPHDFIKKIVSQLEGIKNDVGVTLHVIFDAIKFDVLGVIEVIIKVLQEAYHLLPSLLSLCHHGLQQIRKLVHLIDKNEKEIFYRNHLFPTVADKIERIKDEEENIVPERQTRASAAATDGQHCLLNDYLLPFKRQLYKMVKHTQTIRRLLPTNCLSAFDHFVRLAL